MKTRKSWTENYLLGKSAKGKEDRFLFDNRDARDSVKVIDKKKATEQKLGHGFAIQNLTIS